MNEERTNEHRKYEAAYKLPNYRMSGLRMNDAHADLVALPSRGTYLDVGCGRGEMLDFAAANGFSSVKGVEIVPALIDGHRVVKGEVHDLPFPDRSFTVVTMFDVIEHLIPGDDELACRELERVASKHILLTANNLPSMKAIGEELHINKRPYDEWDALFCQWFSGEVTWLKTSTYVSECWRIDLAR
jgi:ubiquinone/menaquinone biosynthesis C-methylase UbiE